MALVPWTMTIALVFLGVVGVLWVLLAFNLVYALVSAPAGALADRMARTRAEPRSATYRRRCWGSAWLRRRARAELSQEQSMLTEELASAGEMIERLGKELELS